MPMAIDQLSLMSGMVEIRLPLPNKFTACSHSGWVSVYVSSTFILGSIGMIVRFGFEKSTMSLVM